MSKAVGGFLSGLSVLVGLALAIPTGGTSLLATLTGLSAATGALIVAGLAVAAYANTMLMPKGRQQARQAAIVSLSIGEAPRQAVFGTALVGGTLVDAFNFGGKDNTDWECLVICLADHRCEALVGFYVADVYVPFVADGQVAGYNNQLEVHFRNGSPGQAVPPVIVQKGPGWTAQDVGTGLTWVAVFYKADKDDAKNPVWPAGRPSFTWLLKGARCYQARKDGTVGGSGGHRRDDPSTWEWTDNPIDCRYAWVRGIYAQDQVDDPSGLLIGRGLSDVEAPPQNVFARANVCDELVSLDAGGSEKRYCANGVISADETFVTVEEWFASACAGVLAQPEGSVEIEPGQAKGPVFFFSDDDLIVGSKVTFSELLSDSDDDWVNTVVPRYVEPTQKYADHAAPVRRRVEDLVLDGGPREQTLALPIVTSGTQAGRCGEIARRLGRLPKRAQVTLGPGFAEVEEGDWGVWTSTRYLKGESVMFRVEAFQCGENWHMTLNLRQIEAQVYAKDADAASGAVAIGQEEPPAPGTPSAEDWALAAISIDGVPALRVFGPGVVNDYLQRIGFEYTQTEGAAPGPGHVWTSAGSVGPEARERVISGVEGEKASWVAIHYVIGGRRTDSLVLGPVNTPQMTISGFSLDSIASILQDFSEDNDGNSAMPPAATAVTVSGINFNDGGGQVIVSANYVRSTDPEAPNNIDGHLFGILVRSSSAGYTYNAADNFQLRWERTPADQPFARFGSVAVDQYVTAVHLPFRNVRSSTNPETIIYGPAAQSSPTTPYRQATAPDWKGTFDGVTKESIKSGAARANIAIGNDNNISTGRVLADSILDGAINDANWVADLATILLATNDATAYAPLSVTSTGGRLVVRAIINYDVQILDPDPGETVNFTARMLARRSSNGTFYYSDTFTITEVWNASAGTGTKAMGQKVAALEATFDGLPAGLFDVGYRIETNSTCGVTLRGPRYTHGDDKRAAT